jgi:DNA-binding response OmpR family regulator
MSLKILWVEGKRAESPHFAFGLQKKGFNVLTTHTGNEALACLPDFCPNLLIINAASMHTSGKRISKSVRSKYPGLPILLILDEDHKEIDDHQVNVTLVMPFTLRKILNRVHHLLPGNSDDLIHHGPIKLDVARNKVSCLDREVALTPRLTQILRVLMENPGIVVERKNLFRKIWNTEYTLDTRTLDVHISWLRRAIEKDPRNPQFLKTIRGVGYRLDI